MSRGSEAVKAWRRRTKARMIESMGGKCQICGYDRCAGALEFHHLDPTVKENALAGLRADIRSWVEIVKELRKCILICSNCHKEVHYGIAEIPDSFQKFDETFLEYRESKPVDECPQCGAKKYAKNNFCSPQCASKARRRVDWDTIDVVQLMEKHNGVYTHAAEEIGISDSAVRKRYLKVMENLE